MTVSNELVEIEIIDPDGYVFMNARTEPGDSMMVSPLTAETLIAQGRARAKVKGKATAKASDAKGSAS